MGWHHRPGDRVELRYRVPWSLHAGASGNVLVRARPRRKEGRQAPLNFLVLLDDGTQVVVPGGHLRTVGGER